MTTATPQAVSLLKLWELEDPFRRFADWRATGQVVRGVEGWMIPRHADVSELLHDKRVSHAFPRAMLEFALGDGAMADFQTNSLLNREGPDHTRLRRLMAQAFTPRLVLQLRDTIAGMVDELLVPLMDGEVRDLVDHLAFPLPSAVICDLLGLDRVDREEVRRQTARFSGSDRAEVDAVTTWFRDYIGSALEHRRPDANGDLLQRMLAAEEGDNRFSHAEIVDNAVLLFFAGFETTTSLIGAGVAALFDFPDQQARLWAEPSLAGSAVEEFLRYHSPVRAAPRVTVAEIELGGEVIPAGSFLQLLLGSANRDERVFHEPDALDITRAPNPHVSFVAGVHRCLGAMLARVEGEVVFGRLAQRVRDLEPAGTPVPSRSGGVSGYSSVPVRARAA